MLLMGFQPLYDRCGATAYKQLARGQLLFAAQDPQDWREPHSPRGIGAQP